MYYRYFGLQEAPFSIAVNPRYLFMSARHRDALAHLLYGVGEGGGFVLLTGEVGTGKTTVIRSLLEQLPDNTDIALVFNPALNAEELLATVCDELGAAYLQDRHSLKTLTDSLHRFLLKNHAAGRNTVLLIDEAQHLQFEVLEQIRLLTNLETNTKKLLQIILVGQPELRDLLNKPELRQLAQRITARYQLKPLDRRETGEYIRHRLQVAGLPANQTLFPPAVVKKIHAISRGVPRIINVLCDRMLLGAYGQNKTRVDPAIVRLAVGEVLESEEAGRLHPRRWAAPATAALALAGLLVVALLAWRQLHTPVAVAPPALAASPAATPATDPTAAAGPDTARSQVPPPAPSAPSWQLREADAIAALLQHVGFDTDTAGGCHNDVGTEIRCERITVQSWQDLHGYNRPAVLKLLTPAKLLRYVVVTGFNDDYAFVLDAGDVRTQPIAELGRQWTGEALFFWRTHRDYAGPFGLNDSGPLVTWLAQQFATLDHQQDLLSDQRFSEALRQRVMLFQKANGLEADGVVGLRTLLKLNEQLDTPITFSSSPPKLLSADAVSASGGN